jgi:hypothetical protein
MMLAVAPSRRPLGMSALTDDLVTEGGWIVWSDGQMDWLQPSSARGKPGVDWYTLDVGRVAPPRDAWYAPKLDEAAQALGTTRGDLEERLSSPDIVLRATAYGQLLALYGPKAFDAYPTRLTVAAAQQQFVAAGKAFEKRRYFP